MGMSPMPTSTSTVSSVERPLVPEGYVVETGKGDVRVPLPGWHDAALERVRYLRESASLIRLIFPASRPLPTGE